MSAQAHTPSRSSFPVIVAIVVLFLLFFFLTSRIYVALDEPENPIAGSQEAWAEESLAEHEGKAQQQLEGAAVVDEAAGTVRLPIARAMAIVIEERSK